MEVTGTYLYAIMRSGPRLPLDAVGGVPDGASICSTLETAGLTAVTSDYEGRPFSELSRLDLLKALLVHQQVLERVASDLPVLPVKFGTVLRSQEEARSLLERFHARLEGALDDVGDCVEIDLSATWDLQAVLAEIGENDAIRLARTNVSPHADPAARIEVGRLVQEALEERRGQYRRRVLGGLLPLARDAQPNPRPSDDIVLNVAFLVARGSLEAFERAVDRCGEELGDRLTFRYVGPLPPHSFATVEIVRPDAVEIEAARARLGLGDRFSEEEVSARFRELAAREHPDRNPGDPSARERFNAITAARDRLTAYLRGRAGDWETLGDESCALLRVVRADEYVSPEIETRNGSGAAR